MDHIQDKTLDFLNNYNGVIITVNGFIIGLLGGFLVSSGSNNFYFFLGFKTIVLSLISSLLAYPSFIRFSFVHKIKTEKRDNESGSGTPILKHYFRIACAYLREYLLTNRELPKTAESPTIHPSAANVGVSISE